MSARLGHASSFRSAPAALRVSGWSIFIRRMMRTFETRMQLQELDERMLRDIGLSRSAAQREANRAPWDIGPDGKPQIRP
ncbi:hypothetical protein HMPREF9946_04663 [Acetobacteraceae bacterium AT-5844]|nr:hypothetical protein HMPREF9946_04663 [Acetobacteraceae bacterium AT-5844]